MPFQVLVADSTVPNGGKGVFLQSTSSFSSSSTDASSCERDLTFASPMNNNNTVVAHCGDVITQYAGMILSAEQYFMLDASRSEAIHYVIATDKGPLVCKDIHSEDPAECGHKINDAMCLHLPATQRSDSGEASHEMEELLYQQACAYAASSPSVYNVKVDEATCNVVAIRDIRAGEELFLQYGLAYWVSRVANELYWENAVEGDRAAARKLRRRCVELSPGSSIPPLPPRAVLQRVGETTELIDGDSGNLLDDNGVLQTALALFNRDPQVLRVKKSLRRALVVKAMHAMQQE